MMMKLKANAATIALLAGLSILAGCAATQTKELANREQYSGYLSNYDDLKEVTGANGNEYLRWITPGITAGTYTSIYMQSVIFYPKLTPQQLADRDTLAQIRDYLSEAIKKELDGAGVLATGPGPGVAEVQLAITGVYIGDEGVKALEFLPIGAVIGLGERAMGARDQIVQVVVEGKGTDSQSGKLISTVVYKGVGEDLPNDRTQLTLDDVKPVLDMWAKNMVAQSQKMIFKGN
jgi:hypothetical protein